MHRFSSAAVLSLILLVQFNEATVGYRDVGKVTFMEGDESVNEYFDLVFADLRLAMSAKGIDPVHLPSDSDNFTAMLFGSPLDGYIWIGNGEVEGLSTIHRTGNMSLRHVVDEGQEVVVAGDVGLTGLNGQYFTKFYLGPFKNDFGVKFKISYVSLEIETDVFVFPTEITLANCTITDLSTLQVKLHGVGLFDTRVYDLLINTLTQVLQPIITSKISTTICNLLEQAINGGNSPVLPSVM